MIGWGTECPFCPAPGMGWEEAGCGEQDLPSPGGLCQVQGQQLGSMLEHPVVHLKNYFCSSLASSSHVKWSKSEVTPWRLGLPRAGHALTALVCSQLTVGLEGGSCASTSSPPPQPSTSGPEDPTVQGALPGSSSPCCGWRGAQPQVSCQPCSPGIACCAHPPRGALSGWSPGFWCPGSGPS